MSGETRVPARPEWMGRPPAPSKPGKDSKLFSTSCGPRSETAASIGERAARDHAALKPLPPTPYLVAERHLRPVGKDCLVAFGGNLYSVPARQVRPRQLVEIRATKSQIMVHSTAADASGETLLAMHPRAVGRGVRVVEETHWDGLPTGKGRRTTTGDVPQAPARTSSGRGGRTAAGPAEPGCRHPHRGRPPSTVGL